MSATPSRRKSLIRLLLALVVAGLGLGTALLFLKPPAPVLRLISTAGAAPMMQGFATTDATADASMARLIGAYTQMALAAHIAERVAGHPSSDEEALLDIVLFVRRHVLNSIEFDHIPRAWPVLIAGAGYCDQVNGAVAMIAARRFEGGAQIYALHDLVNESSPHTIGRVWSAQRQKWLYFDAFYEDPVIFTKDATNAPQFLTVSSKARIPGRGRPPQGLYALGGWVLADFYPTFGRYLWERGSTAVRARVGAAPTPAGERARPRLSAYSTALPVALPPVRYIDEEAFETIAEEFVEARVDEMLTDRPSAAYRRIGSHPAAAADDRAAYVAAIAKRLASRSDN